MKTIKKYNPLGLNVEKDPPTFENGEGKFWLVEADFKLGVALYLAQLKKNNELNYIVVNENGTPIHEDKNLEGACSFYSLYIQLTKKGSIN